MWSPVRTWTTPAPHRRVLVAPVQGLLLAVTFAFVLSTLLPRSGFDVLVDGWLQAVGYCLAAGLALLRPLLCGVDRLLWGFVAAGLVARAAAFVVYLGFVRLLDPQPYPSLADVGWLLSCAFLLAALFTFARSRFRFMPSTLVLDGIVAGCAVGAFALLVLPTTVDMLTPAGTPRAALWVNTLYPVADVVLLLAVLGVLIAYRWRAPPALWVFGAGVVGFAVLDVTYLYQLSRGTFAPATPLSGLSLLASTVIAFAAWAPPGRPTREQRAFLPGLVIPATLAIACLSLLVWAAFVDAPPATVLLAAAGVGATVVRTVVGFRDLRQLSVVRREARTDDLTGLANRRALNEAVRRLLRHRPPTAPLALLVLDLDSFKEVNDGLGHHRGDELLQLIAPRLQRACRPQDVAARIGGDEFAVLLDGADERAAAEAAQRLRTACRGPFDLAGQRISVGVSIGIALFPQDGQDGDALLQHADNAMYSAKDDRTGHAFYRPDYQQGSRARLDAVNAMREALARGQFVAHYQPKVALADGQVVGVEALVRWQHPTRGLLAPGAFLQQAERGGLMRELTMHVLDQTLRQWAEWHAAGIDTSAAVNLSVSDLLDRGFPAQVEDVRRRHGAPGSALVLELTEDLLLADPTRGHAVIEDLAAQGVRVQVDDYGTGFSTLGYLRDLPGLHGLKLDRSFVTRVAEDARSQAIVASTIGLAADLGLELVAEGVETTAALERLRDLGCPQAQGYLFGRPVPAPEVRFGRYDVEAGVVR